MLGIIVNYAMRNINGIWINDTCIDNNIVVWEWTHSSCNGLAKGVMRGAIMGRATSCFFRGDGTEAGRYTARGSDRASDCERREKDGGTEVNLRVAYLLPEQLRQYVGPVGVWGDINDILQENLAVMKVGMNNTRPSQRLLQEHIRLYWRAMLLKNGLCTSVANTLLEGVQLVCTAQYCEVC